MIYLSRLLHNFTIEYLIEEFEVVSSLSLKVFLQELLNAC